jgi:hypothetical protein
MATAQQRFKQMMPTVMILYGALVFSTILLAVVSFVVSPDPRQPPPQASLEQALVAVAFCVAVASFILPAKMLPPPARSMEVLPPDFGPDGRPQPARFAAPDVAAGRAMAYAQTGFILRMALSEAVSCIGLALHMMGAPRTYSLPLFAAGTVLAAIRFPSVARMVAPFEKVHGASFEVS